MGSAAMIRQSAAAGESGAGAYAGHQIIHLGQLSQNFRPGALAVCLAGVVVFKGPRLKSAGNGLQQLGGPPPGAFGALLGGG